MWSHGPRHKRIKDVLRGRLFHFIKKRAYALFFCVRLFTEEVRVFIWMLHYIFNTSFSPFFIPYIVSYLQQEFSYPIFSTKHKYIKTYCICTFAAYCIVPLVELIAISTTYKPWFLGTLNSLFLTNSLVFSPLSLHICTLTLRI